MLIITGKKGDYYEVTDTEDMVAEWFTRSTVGSYMSKLGIRDLGMTFKRVPGVLIGYRPIKKGLYKITTFVLGSDLPKQTFDVVVPDKGDILEIKEIRSNGDFLGVNIIGGTKDYTYSMSVKITSEGEFKSTMLDRFGRITLMQDD